MVHTKSARLLPLAVGLAVALSGCAASKNVRQITQAGQQVTHDRYEAVRTPRTESRAFMVQDGFYAARKPISVTPINPALALPPRFFQSANMDVQTPISVTEVGSLITKMTGYRVMVDQDVLSGGGGTPSRAPAAVAPPTALPTGPLPDPSMPPGTLPPLPASLALANAPSDAVLEDVVYRGNLAGLLDEVTGRLNLSWRWTGDRIEIFRFETKMFRLNALAGKMSSDSNLSLSSSTSQGGAGGGGAGGSSGGGNTGSSGSNISVSSEMEVWSEVEQNIEAMLSPDGKMSAAPSAGIITVRDTPAVLDQVEAQVAEFNRIYSKQVMLHVEVYSVERNQGDEFGINWNALWATAANSLGFSFSSAGDSGAGPAFTIDVNDNSSPFAGSSVVGRALSSAGDATLITSGTAISLNGQTVPFNVSREQAYLQSSSTSISGEGGLSSTTLTPGVATEGFSMTFTPRILDNNKVLVRYSVDLSVIEEIETFSAPGGTSAIQLPRRSVRNFLQNVSVPSGDSLVLTGFQQVQGTRNSQGPLSPHAWLLGGDKSANESSRTIVIVVTPYVMQQ